MGFPFTTRIKRMGLTTRLRDRAPNRFDRSQANKQSASRNTQVQQANLAPRKASLRPGIRQRARYRRPTRTAYRLSKRPMPKYGRMLVSRNCNPNDLGKHLHQGMQLLRNSNGKTHRARPLRTPPGRRCRSQNATSALRTHLRRP